MTRDALNSVRWEALSHFYWEALQHASEGRAAYLVSSGAPADIVAEVIAMLDASEAGRGTRIERRFVAGDDAPPGLAPGTRLGFYELLDLVGRGGMGEVYRARRVDGELELTVAIKVLRSDARSESLTRRFVAERALLARLNHPNIASILDAGTAPDGRPFLVLRFVEGEPITQYAARIPLGERLRLFSKVAAAVQFAHTHLVIHRDLKPSNILVTSAGEPVLLDFGIAKLLGDSHNGVDETHAGERLLTPSHAAPEQLRGEAVTTATDVYGLGGLLFELLTGRHPFAEQIRTRGQIEQAVLDTPVPLPSAAVRDQSQAGALRGDLDCIVQMAMRKEADRRYASAAQFADDVQRHLTGLPVHARPDRWSYRASRFVQRNRVATAAAALLATVLMVALTREVVQSRRLATERDRAVKEREAGEDVLAFITDLFAQSNPRVVPGADTLRVGPFLTLAETRVTELNEQPERQMRLYRSLGNVRFSRGDYVVAESLLALSVDLGTRTLGRDHLEVLRTRQSLSDVLVERRGEPAARQERDSVLRMLLRTVGPAHPDVADAYVRLAGVTADVAVVRALLDTAVTLKVRAGVADSMNIADMFDEQARLYGLRAQPIQAAALEDAALRIVVTRFPPEHANVLTVKGNLATWLNGAGEWERALTLATEVLNSAKRQTTAGHAFAIAHERVALIAINIPGRLALADSLSRVALATFRAAVAPDHPLVASSMRNLAIILAQGGRVTEGLALLDSSIALRKLAGDTSGWQYMEGQRVPMLVALRRPEEALQSANIARVARPALPAATERVALIDWHSGLAAMAASRTDDAARFFADVVEADAQADSGTLRAWRMVMARCALGAALAGSRRTEEAQVHLQQACPALKRWGRADASVVAWGEAARAKLRK
ncbi:MAG: serine/threonine protein kinase [Phycisphaerae bacterium]|nr:serine/threonine protein kinase [Gemmatimonadaceae bacterium]